MANAKFTTAVRRSLALGALAIAIAACSGQDDSSVTFGDPATLGDQTASISIPNDGTSQWEGHTPRGFAGTGTGLFVGDNLNPNFPDGEGLQILLTFALPEGVATPSSATLSSSVLQTSGDVFEALGEIEAAPVSYEQFGPELFNIAPSGDLVTCERPSDTELSCDVTAAAQSAVESGADRVQIRLTLEELADNDGQQDLALFNNGDSNTNEAGLFTLQLS